MDERYKALSTPPDMALKTIQFGALKGKSEINPQWKIQVMTEQFGLCGVGWKFEIASTDVRPLDDGTILLFMQVNLYVKDGDKWSEAIPGCGGDFIVDKNKNGLVANDEAYKMCLTDALGNAFKCVGVAADVYLGLCDTKYSKQEAAQPTEQPAKQRPVKTNAPPKHPNATQLAELQVLAKQKGSDIANILSSCKINKLEEMSMVSWAGVMTELRKRADV